MKQLRHLLFLASVSIIALVSCEAKTISTDDIPSTSKNFIEEYFPDASILNATKDYNEYEVILSNGIEIDFNAKGEWTSIDSPAKAIPAGIIPEKIAECIATDYPTSIITEISKEKYGYDVEIDNFRDLEFDKNGKFIREDFD